VLKCPREKEVEEFHQRSDYYTNALSRPVDRMAMNRQCLKQREKREEGRGERERRQR
jgi:hypothetical protein